MENNIFISYGHDKYCVVPEKVATLLESEGFKVFIDKKLSDNRLFDVELENRIAECDIVILFMTQHSVRESGVCRDELAYARNLEKRVIPVMLEKCQTPLLVSRIQWIGCDCVVPDDNNLGQMSIIEDGFIAFYSRLVAAIKDPSSVGKEGSILSQLNPENLDIEIAKNSAMCNERRTLTDIIQLWVTQTSDSQSTTFPNILWLCGNMGSGKSCFVSWLAIHKPYVVGLHLCRAQMPRTCSIRSVCSTLAYSLAVRSVKYQDKLNKNFDFSRLDSLSSSELFKAFFVDGTKNVDDIQDCEVFVIDGVDELDRNAQDELAEALISNSKYLPGWMKFILTSRDNRHLKGVLSFVTEVVHLDSPNFYVDPMRQLINRCSREIPNADAIIRNSAGSFIYVKCLLEEFSRSGRIESYPTTMAAIYQHSFNRLFPGDSFEDVMPILQIMVVARHPLTVMEYAYLLEKTQREIMKLLDRLGSFVVSNNGLYSLYHKSLLDWLTDENNNVDYYIARKDADMLVSKIIELQFSTFIDSSEKEYEYIKRYGFYHLIKSRSSKLISRLIERDEQYLEDSFIDTITDLAFAGSFEDIRWIYGTFSTLPAANIAVRRMTKRLIEFGFYDRISSLFQSGNKSFVFWVGPYAELLDKRMKGRTKDVIEDCHLDLWGLCPDHVKADVLFYEGEGNREQGNMLKAKECYYQAANMSKANHTTNTSYFLSLVNIADVEFVNGDIPKALQLLAEIENDPGILAIESARYITNRLKGHIYQALQEIEKSKFYYLAALDCARNLKKRYSIIESLNSLAEVGSPQESLEFLSQSLEMFGGEDDENYTIEKGKAYYILAKTQIDIGQYEDALANANKSIELLSDRYVPGLLYAYYEKGVALLNLGEVSNSLEVLRLCCSGYHKENIYPNRRLEALKYMLKAKLLAKDFTTVEDRIADIPNMSFFSVLENTIEEVKNLELSFDLLRILNSENNQFSIGYHNENYAVSLGDDKYIVRLPVEDFENVDIRLNDENEMLKYAEKYLPFLYAPRYIYKGQFGHTSFSIHSFVNGVNLSEIMSEVAPLDDVIVDYLANQIARMHMCSRDHVLSQHGEYSDVQSFYAFDYSFISGLVRKWYNKLKGMFLDFGFPEDISGLLVERSNQLENRKFVLCHCDIHRGNLLYEPTNNGFEIHFIDWELVQYADPVYDLAVHFHKIHYTQEQELRFLSIYCEALEEDVDSVLRQIQVYQELEEVKSATIDAIRYASGISDLTKEKRLSNNEKYLYKLKSLASRFPKLITSGDYTVEMVDRVFMEHNYKVKQILS